MKAMTKRIISLALCFVMFIGLLPLNAYAEETTGENASAEVTEVTEATQAASEPEADSATGETEEPSEPEATGDPAVTEATEAAEPSEDPTESTEESMEASTEATEDPAESSEPEASEEPETTEETESEAVAVTGIVLDQTALEVGVGAEPVTLTATVLPEDATDKTVTWTSSEPGVASVVDGIVTFGYMGEAVITAAAGEFTATCTVVVGEGDTSAYAGDTIYVLAGGDFQEAGDHANSAENVTNILAQVSQKYTTMDGFLFIGDYDCETHDSATETANGITALMGAVQGSYDNLNNDNSVLVQGNHDYMDSRIDATGGHDFTGYAAYVLNEDDYPNGGGSQSGIQTLANNLKTWLNNKIGEGYTAPIFVVSHLPLAFTPRTVTQGDAKYAKYIFDVLNTAGEEGLNIIFLHGHDHAYGPDNYMGGEAIYLAEGDKICIAEAGSTSAWTEETLNFTYMNAGYTGYYSDPYTYVTTAGTDKLTMTVFAITDNQVTVERYSANGLYNLKSAGYDGSYSDTAVTNVSLKLPTYSTVYASPQTIALTSASTDDGTASGTIGGAVEVPDEVPTDDVTTSGGSAGVITAPVPGTEATPGSTTYEYTLDTDGVNNDLGYLIVDSSAAKAMGNGSLTAVDTTINGSTATMASRDYEWTITSDGKITNGTYWLAASIDWRSGSVSLTTNENDAYSWTISHSGNGAYQITGKYSGYWTTTYYLRYSNNAFSITSSSNTVRLYGYNSTITTPGTEATPGTNGVYYWIEGELSYTVARGTDADTAMDVVMAGIDGYYYEGMTAPDANTEGTKVEDSVLTWEWVDTFDGNTPGDYAVKISYQGVQLGIAEVVVPATSKFYVAEGNGLYTVDMDTSADDALAAVKAGITVYSATDANGTNKTEISDDDVTWNWVDTYDGTNYGPYTVEILYNGTSLGTVEVKVDVKYDTGITDGWTPVGTQSGGYKYVLDTDGIEYGESNKYIIVAANQALALHATSSANGTAESITIDGTTATTTTRDYEYHFIQTSYNGTRYELITKGDGSSYLYQQDSGVRYGTRSSVKFQINHHGSGIYDIHDIDGTNWYLIYNGSWTVVEDTSSRVRLYKYDGEIVEGDIYARIEGNTVYTVTQGTGTTSALSKVKAGITGYISNNADGSDATELADSQLTWKWLNTYNANVTGSYWVEISYNGIVLGTVEVKVEPGVVNNYPEYPDEGAVKVNKTATGIDFQSSGVAQVEVSASGVPMKKGIDVIIMLDTSSSMAYCLNCNDTRHSSYECDQGGQTRAQALEETLGNLIKQFKTPGDDGQLLDIDVAIADFNGFYGDGHSKSGTPYDRDAADMMSDDISYTANSAAQIYTGDGTLSEGAFIAAENLAASYTLNYASGTNYDYAMDAIYQMANAKRLANGAEDRDLFVLFLTDGAAMQWNGYHSQGNSSLWNSWITGAWDADDLTTANLNCTEHAYYYDEVDHDGDGQINEHRMANAIKGDPTDTFEVIRKTNDLGAATDEENMYLVSGLGAKMFSIAFDPRVDTNVTVDSLVKSVATIASDQTGTTQYFYNVSSADELASAFTAIGSEIAYAAYNARFVDQMGDSYNLQLKTSTYTVLENGVEVEKTLAPVIEILTYDIYTRQDYLNGTITEDKIGDRKGTSTLNEVVMFSADGTKAYSNLIDVDKDGIYGVTVEADGTYTISDTDDNILGTDGVIYAVTFLYNTGVTDVTITGVDIPTGTTSANLTTGSTSVLPSETFYWKLGTVQTSELAMRYYVYLEGSMEGTMEAGSYPTNEFATLYYDNYLENPCYKETVSPVMAWKEANVSYAFYLVDKNGNIIVNQTTGETGSFANKIAITNPVVYQEILLNNTDQIEALEVAALGEGVLPTYYQIYDREAVYTVSIYSNGTGSWNITKGSDTVASTYVTQYKIDDASAYSNALTNDTVGDDYTHTIVWFAVVWSVQAHPDAVVIDYGLPVDISVLTNDMFGENGKLAGVGAYSDSLNLDAHDDALASGFGTSYTGSYGTAAADAATGKVRYTPTTMQMNSYEKFAYAVNYTGSENAGYYYDTITVIPATTVYYEDSFINYSSQTYSTANKGWVDHADGEHALWSFENNADAVQDEDRPGLYSLSYVDANNIYGYDGAYSTQSAYSQNGYAMATVDYDNSAIAEFDFCGTGFDVISMTSSTTGTIYVRVYNYNQNSEYNVADALKSYVVDTYYGYDAVLCHVTYTYTNGEWVKTVGEPVAEGVEENYVELPDTADEGTVLTGVENSYVVSPNTDNAIYQVPVMKIKDLPYGQYHAEIRVIYDPIFDHVEDTNKSYVFYLDAIRIYDPANDGAADGATDTTIEDAYVADGEGWPSYIELRNSIIAANSFDNVANDALTTDMEGLVFIDGDASVGDAQISDYVSYGPNNEVYLAPGQRVAFILNTPENIDNVHIGLKSADGADVTCTITNIAKESNTETGVKAGDYYGARTTTLHTSTDMYYDLTGWKGDIIVISNTGDRYNTTGILSITNIKSTYTSDPNGTVTTTEDDSGVSTASEVTETSEVSAVNETTLYMTPAAATLTLRTLNTMDLAESGDDSTGSETTEPEASEPVETEPTVTEPEVTEPETTEPAETEPEATEPETTEPAETEPEATEPEIEEVKTFEPKTFRVTLSARSVKVGGSVIVTVTTGTDVAALAVNGQAVATYTESRWTKTRTWIVRLDADEVGEMEIAVVAYDAESVASQPVVNSVTVKEKGRNSISDILGDIFGWLFR